MLLIILQVGNSERAHGGRLAENSHEIDVCTDLGCAHLKAQLGWTPELIWSHSVPVPDGWQWKLGFGEVLRCASPAWWCQAG